jgi:hypothetical protein
MANTAKGNVSPVSSVGTYTVTERSGRLNRVKAVFLFDIEPSAVSWIFSAVRDRAGTGLLYR